MGKKELYQCFLLQKICLIQYVLFPHGICLIPFLKLILGLKHNYLICWDFGRILERWQLLSISYIIVFANTYGWVPTSGCYFDKGYFISQLVTFFTLNLRLLQSFYRQERKEWKKNIVISDFNGNQWRRLWRSIANYIIIVIIIIIKNDIQYSA